jgi:hypothetical protein
LQMDHATRWLVINKPEVSISLTDESSQTLCGLK